MKTKRVSYETLEALLKEVDKAVADKHRVTSDIENDTVKAIVQHAMEQALRCSRYRLGIVEIGVGVQAGMAIAAGTGAGGAVAGGALGGGVIAGFTAGTAGGMGLALFGTIIGGGVVIGGLIGGGIVWWRKSTENRKKRVLMQETMAKQKGRIKELANEVEQLKRMVDVNNRQNKELKEQLNERDRQNNELQERLKYVLGVLAGYECVKGIICP